MKPTLALGVRLRFSTKDVGKGFYRGNRTGSMGAHTPKGGYIIDYRKVRNYNVPDLKDFKLTPYVTREIGESESPEQRYPWLTEVSRSLKSKQQDDLVARRTRAMKFINEWRSLNPAEFEQFRDHQEQLYKDAAEATQEKPR